MRRCGLDVSKEEHSWKDNIDASILEHNFELIQCEADSCACTFGRKYEPKNSELNDPWTMLICDGCGSNGMHLKCLNLETVPKGAYLCQPCGFGATGEGEEVVVEY